MIQFPKNIRNLNLLNLQLRHSLDRQVTKKLLRETLQFLREMPKLEAEPKSEFSSIRVMYAEEWAR